MMAEPRRSQRGQALVEMAFVLPVGVLVLLAVGYLGRALLERQTLVAAARHAAREAAVSATRRAEDKALGAGVIREAGTAGGRASAIAAAAAGRPAESAPPRWDFLGGAHLSQLKLLPMPPYGLGLVARHSTTVEGTTLKFGIGVVLYGARAKERLAFLEPVRKATYGASQANPKPARGLAAPLEISASAYMPGELPVHHPQVGLVEINPWIKDILEEDL